MSIDTEPRMHVGVVRCDLLPCRNKLRGPTDNDWQFAKLLARQQAKGLGWWIFTIRDSSPEGCREIGICPECLKKGA